MIELAKKGTDKVMFPVVSKATAAVLSRGGVGATKKYLENKLKNGEGNARVRQLMKDKGGLLKGNLSEDQVADLMAQELVNTKLADEAVALAIAQNSKEIGDLLKTELRPLILKELEKAQKKLGGR